MSQRTDSSDAFTMIISNLAQSSDEAISKLAIDEDKVFMIQWPSKCLSRVLGVGRVHTSQTAQNAK